MVEADEEDGDEWIGDEEEEDIEEILLEIEREPIECLGFLVNEIVVDQVWEEGSH